MCEGEQQRGAELHLLRDRGVHGARDTQQIGVRSHPPRLHFTPDLVGCKNAVLWIQIRLDPEFFPGSGSGILFWIQIQAKKDKESKCFVFFALTVQKIHRYKKCSFKVIKDG